MPSCGQTDPQASALYSWKSDEDTLGVLVAAIYQKRHLRRDGVEVLGYFTMQTRVRARFRCLH